MKWNKRKTKVVEEQLEELSSPELEEIVDNKVDLDGATGDESSNNDLIFSCIFETSLKFN